jgi:hypothetical protein
MCKKIVFIDFIDEERSLDHVDLFRFGHYVQLFTKYFIKLKFTSISFS